jgi:hypothetical protein
MPRSPVAATLIPAPVITVNSRFSTVNNCQINCQSLPRIVLLFSDNLPSGS